MIFRRLFKAFKKKFLKPKRKKRKSKRKTRARRTPQKKRKVPAKKKVFKSRKIKTLRTKSVKKKIKKKTVKKRKTPLKKRSKRKSVKTKKRLVKRAISRQERTKEKEKLGDTSSVRVLVGEITHYFSKIEVCVIKMTAGAISVGDKLFIEGPAGSFEQKVQSLQIENDDVKAARKGQLVGMKIKSKVKEGYLVYKIK